MTVRGWTTAGLSLVETDERLWTVAQASRLLGPPVLQQWEVRRIIRWMNIQPVGTCKQDGPEKRGRQPRVYRAVDLIRAYDVLSKAA
jgi:hypothetical protein